jgi:hypothetical protein
MSIGSTEEETFTVVITGDGPIGPQGPPGTTLPFEQLPDQPIVVPDPANFYGGILSSLSQDTLFNPPAESPPEGSPYTLRMTAAAVRQLSWNAMYHASGMIPLPSQTSGSGMTDYLLFIYNAETNHLDLAGLVQGF